MTNPAVQKILGVDFWKGSLASVSLGNLPGERQNRRMVFSDRIATEVLFDRDRGDTSIVESPQQRSTLRVECKRFAFDLCENQRGRFLRIVEEVGGRQNAIMVPVSGLEQFRDMLSEIIKHSKSPAGRRQDPTAGS